MTAKEEEELEELLRSDGSHSKQFVRKHIGLFSASMMIVGHIIGTGIFITPKGVVRFAGSVGLSLVIWFLCGIISVCGSKIFLELGTSIPKSGNSYIYLKTAFGELIAFLYLWIFVVVQTPSNLAIASLTFSNYVLEPVFKNCNVPAYVTNLIAILILTFITFINCYNVHLATRVQNVFSLAKLLALIVIILAGVTHLISGNVQNFQDPFEGSTTDPGYIVLAFYSGMFTYSGWNALNSVTEEIKDPSRNMPKAVYIAISLTTVVYILTNIAYFSVLSSVDIKSSNAVAVTFGDRTLGAMSWIMPFSVAMSCFGSLNGNLFTSARVLFVAASEGHLPSCLSMINVNFLTPMPSLIFLCLFGLMYSSTSEIYVLITYTTFMDSLIFALVSIGLIRLRYTQPYIDRPIKVNLFFPVAFFILCLCFIVIPCYVTPWETGIGVVITLLGIPVYYLLVRQNIKSVLITNLKDKVTYAVQVLTNSVYEEKNE